MQRGALSVVEQLEASGEILSPAVRAALVALEQIAARVPLLGTRIQDWRLGSR